MKLKPFEKLLVNIEASLHFPDPVRINEEWVENYNGWVYRATVVLAIGVKPTTLRYIQQAGDRYSITHPRFIGRFRLQSAVFFLDEAAHAKVSFYHKQVEAIATYCAEHKLFAPITEFPPMFYMDDPRFKEILEQQRTSNAQQ